MKPIGLIVMRLRQAAAKKNISLDELVRELIERFAIEPRPAIVRERNGQAFRRVRRQERKPVDDVDIIASHDPFTSLMLHLRDNFTLSEIDEL